MGAIELRPDLHESVVRDAERESRSVDDVVNEAVERYLRERQRAKLDQEIAVYRAMHAELKQKYLGQWVAVHEGKLVDHDSDGTVLYRRVRVKYGRTSVLIRQVAEQADEDIWFRTPSTGKIQE